MLTPGSVRVQGTEKQEKMTKLAVHMVQPTGVKER